LLAKRAELSEGGGDPRCHGNHHVRAPPFPMRENPARLCEYLLPVLNEIAAAG